MIKKTLLFLLITLSFSATAQTTDEIFKEANTLYQQKEYKLALDKYEEILNTGYNSSELYYNIANTHYKLEEVALSILFYKRTLKLDPNFDDAIFNLKMAKLKSVDKFDTIPETFFLKFWKSFSSVFSIYQWSITAIVLAFITSIFFIIFLFNSSSTLKRLSFVISLSSIILMLTAIFISHQQDAWQKANKQGVIMVENSYIKVAPDDQSEDSFILHEGTEIIVIDNVGDWLRIKLVDGKKGWIHQSNIMFV